MVVPQTSNGDDGRVVLVVVLVVLVVLVLVLVVMMTGQNRRKIF